MIKIETFGMAQLHNNEHFQFMSDFDALIITYTPLELGIDKLHPPFRYALSNEKIALEVEKGSSKSKAIEDQDKLRDKTWNAIRTCVKACRLSPIDDEVESASEIKRFFDINGDIRKFSLNEKSAAITTLTTLLLQPENVTDLDKLKITTWVTMLKTQNERFQALFNERNTELANRASGDVHEARREVDPLYEQIVERINATIVMGTAKPAATSFATDLNERFNYYRTTLAARAGRNKNKNKESLPPDSKG